MMPAAQPDPARRDDDPFVPLTPEEIVILMERGAKEEDGLLLAAIRELAELRMKTHWPAAG